MNDSPRAPRALRWLVLLASLLAVVLTLALLWREGPRQPASGAAGATTAATSSGQSQGAVAPDTKRAESFLDAKTFHDFRQWNREFAQVAPAPADRERKIAEGVSLARERQARMKRLIRTHPEQAIAESLSFADWEALPEEVRALVERPFSAKADYHYYPICTPPGQPRPAGTPEFFANLYLPDGTKLEAFAYGQRGELMSKRELAVQGIALDGVAAIRDGVFQEIPAGSLDAARRLFPAGQADPAVSFATGQPVGPDAVTAVAGGLLYAFANPDELRAFAARFARLEALPGPDAASAVLGTPMAAGAGGAFDWNAVETAALNQASAWTETKKTCFLIRINFTDALAEPVTQAAANTVMNGAASDQIRAMSYGKTWLECTTSANVYTMPQVTSYYQNGGTGLNDELLRDGRNTFRNQKSGADAGINIGPVSNTGTGDSGGVGDYDIVGIFFGDIGMVSGNGVYYAGLAGGNRLWVQDANYASLYAHEWGHNYGLGHASSWDTTDGSVVGTGASTEYGDPFDIMGSGPVPEGHYHPQGKANLNWLTTSDWVDATAAGSNTYRIYRVDDPATTGIRGLRVTKVATPGSQEYYWLAYRPVFANNVHFQHGAYLTWQRPGQTRCWFLDTTPGTADGKNDGGVDVGRTYADATANVYITPLATGGSGSSRYLDVRVNLGPFPGNHAPTSSAISGPATVLARTNATFAVSPSDADGDALAYAWDSQDGASNDNAASVTHSWTAGGVYTLTATVSDMKGGTVTLTKSVTVTDPVDTWTQHSVGTTEDLKDVVYAKGRFVAAEYWGTIYESWDGNSWTNVGDPPTIDQPRLAYGNQVFVAAGKIESAAAAQVCYSSDGRSWTAANFPGGAPQVREVTFGNGKFVAVGDSGTVLSSTDGINWSLTTVSGSPNLRNVAWDGSAWIALGMSTRSFPDVIWTSADAVTWTQRNTLGADIFRVYGANGVMYLLGWYQGVKYSTDHGLTWQSGSTPGTTRWTTNRMAMAGDGTFFVTAEAMDESGTPNALLVSADGVHWSRTTVNGGNPTVGNANGLVFGFGKFLSVENGGVTRSSDAFDSPNAVPVPAFTANPATGAPRQVISFGASATDGDGDSLTYAWDFGSQYPILDGSSVGVTFPFGGSYSATLYVSDGRGGLASLAHNITVNDPARTFTQRTSGTTNTLNAIATNGSLAVAVGGSGGVIRTSTDGVTWTARSVSEFTGNLTFRDVAWDGAKFIAVGTDYNFTAPAGWQGTVYTSADGLTWTRRYGTTNRSDELYGVAGSSSAGVVAVGTSGAVLSSADGITWNSIAVPGVAPNMRGAAWNGSVFVITGYSSGSGTGRVFTSTDRTNWMDVTSGTGIDASWQDLRKIAWLNNRFVSSGWYSKLRVSTDNAQTFSTTRSVSERNPALAYGDGIYFTAGEQLGSPNVDVDVLSQDGVTWYSFAAPTTNNRNGGTFFKHTFITVGDLGEIWQSGDVTPPSGFPAWQTAQFPGGGTSALPNGDPDHDGIPNLVEYALSRNPSANGGTEGSPGSGHAVFDSGRNWLHLDMPEPAASDVTYVIQGCTELGGTWVNLAQKTGTGSWTWTGGGTAHLTEGAVSGGRKPVEVGTPDNASGQPRYFLRLQVVGP